MDSDNNGEDLKRAASRRFVAAVVDDLFFAAKIEAVARQIGANLALVGNWSELTVKLEKQAPDLIIVDLNSNSAPIEVVSRLKADPRLAHVPVVGFFSHVQVELERTARQAGCDRILARSAFTLKLPAILRGVDG